MPCCNFCAPEMGIHCSAHCTTPDDERPEPSVGAFCTGLCDAARGKHDEGKCLTAPWLREKLLAAKETG